jgi:hypothetical protein
MTPTVFDDQISKCLNILNYSAKKYHAELCDQRSSSSHETKHSVTGECHGRGANSASDSAFEKSNSSFSHSSSDRDEKLIASSSKCRYKKSSGKLWTVYEEKALRRGMKMFGSDWKEIINYFFEHLKDRSVQSLQNKAKSLGLSKHKTREMI